MFQTPFSDAIRSEVDMPTITVGNITTADQVNTIVAAGRADLVALARPHLTNPNFTLAASAYYGWDRRSGRTPISPARIRPSVWLERDNAELAQLREQARAPITARRTAFLASRD